MKQVVLITGANGFIPNCLGKLLVAEYEVRYLTRKITRNNEYLWNLKNKSIDPKGLMDIIQYFRPIKVIKNELLVEKGNVCCYLFFVNEGCIKACFIDSNGQETIRYVAFENQFISSIHSFIKQVPSSEFICAVEASELLAISYTDFRSALSRISLFKDFYIKMLEGTYLNNHWRIETFLRLDAKQRYEYILEHNKQLVQRLSNKNLSSFLGITQESLSRIKAKK